MKGNNFMVTVADWEQFCIDHPGRFTLRQFNDFAKQKGMRPITIDEAENLEGLASKKIWNERRRSTVQ